MRFSSFLTGALAVMVCLTNVVGAAEKVPPGQVFNLSPTSPRFATSDIEFRDAAGVKWPMFFYGRPAADGTYTYDPAQPQASFALKCDQLVQRNGDQSRKILGELVKSADAVPVVTFTVTAISPFEVSTNPKSPDTATLTGELDVGGRKVPVQAKANFRYDTAGNAPTPTEVAINVHFTIEGTQLGLKAPGATGPINVRVGTMAYIPGAKPKGK